MLSVAVSQNMSEQVDQENRLLNEIETRSSERVNSQNVNENPDQLSIRNNNSFTSVSGSRKVVPYCENETQPHLSEHKLKVNRLKQLTKRQLSEKEISKMVEKVEKLSMQPAKPLGGLERRFLLDPNGWFRNRFDLAVIGALMFVAIVTPFEVSFLHDDDSLARKIVNRVIDVIFGLDIFLNFFTPYQTAHGVWITKHKDIALYYSKSWLLIDLVSVMPFEMVKMIRLLRLAKLLRIFRASRVLKRWETRMAISYGYITLTKFIIYMLLLSHWLACLFRLVPTYEMGQQNWLDGYLLGQNADLENITPWDEYNVALYWAVMTVTTIGYGDVTPQTDAERWVIIFSMMVGGAAYAYIVGSVCGLVASMGELTTRLHRKIDDLNVYMEDQKLPQGLRIQLREYFHYTAKQQRNLHYQLLLSEMSPEMRGDIYRRVNEQWVNKLPFVACASAFERRGFVTAVASRLTQQIFPPKERIARPGEIANAMYVIERGIVMMNRSYFVPPELRDVDEGAIQCVEMKNTLGAAEKEILTRGKSFGHDMVLTHARRRYHCMSLTYVELHQLSKKSLMEVFEEDQFPETGRNYRKFVVKLAFRTKFVRIAKLYKAKQSAEERLRAQTEKEDPKTSYIEYNEKVHQNILKELNDESHGIPLPILDSSEKLSHKNENVNNKTTTNKPVTQAQYENLMGELSKIKELLLQK